MVRALREAAAQDLTLTLDQRVLGPAFTTVKPGLTESSPPGTLSSDRGDGTFRP